MVPVRNCACIVVTIIYKHPVQETKDRQPLLSTRFFKIAMGTLQSLPCVRLSITLSPPKPLDDFLFVCLILFFTSTQQSFSYAGRFFLGLTSTKLG